MFIDDWEGSGVGVDQIFVGNNANTLTMSQLSQTLFRNPTGIGLSPGNYAAKLLSTGELVPVPEPNAYLIGILMLTIAVMRCVRKELRVIQCKQSSIKIDEKH